MANLELSISPDYVGEWGLAEAVREIFQNALDQQEVNPENVMSFDYDPLLRVMKIGSKQSTLDPSTLVLGNTTKAKSDDLIGQFGEGYKLALVVLLRLGKSVTIYNNPFVWTPSIKRSEQFNTPVLNINIVKYRFKELPENDLVFTISGVTPEEFETVKASNLYFHDVGEAVQHTCGRILLQERYKGEVYVKGLFVGRLKNGAHFGYDMLPAFVKLGRDRDIMSEWDIFYRTSEMWAEQSEHAETVDKMIKAAAPDVEYITSYLYRVPEHTIEYVTCRFREEHGCNAYPVSSQKEADLARKLYGEDVKVVVVTRQMLALLQKSEYFKGFTAPDVASTSPHEYLKPLLKKMEKFPPTLRPLVKAACEMSKHWRWDLR